MHTTGPSGQILESPVSNEEVLSIASVTLQPAERRLVKILATHVTANGGVLTVQKESGGRYVGGYHFGQEDPDSDMAGGAAYGMGPTILGVLEQIVDQVGLARG